MMTQIEWRSNLSRDLVAFENSRPLSDFENPEEQAVVWAHQISLDDICEEICVIGGGAGYHIEALLKAYPGKKITVLDSRPSLISFLKKKYPQVDFIHIEKIENLKNLDNIHHFLTAKVQKLMFKPAIGYQAEILEEVYWFLNLRTYDALSFHLNKKIEGKSQVLISFKQFVQHVDAQYTDYTNAEIQTLKEMIR